MGEHVKPPEEGEVTELVSVLGLEADAESPLTHLQWATHDQLRRTAELLQHLAAAAPQAAGEEPTDEELDELAWNWYSKTGSTWHQIEAFRAFARAVLARWGRPALPPAERDAGDVAIDRWIESRPGWPNDWPAVTQCQLNALIGEALEHWGRPALSPVPVSERLPEAVEQVLIKAECALADIAEGEPMNSEGDPLEWAERRATDALRKIRPLMRQYQIHTSEWPPLPAHALPVPEVTE